MLHSLLPALCLLFGFANGACPHTATDLVSFSSLYPSPTTAIDVSITAGTLLDVASLDVNTIVISGSGKLVFQPGQDISIRTRGIRIKDDGELIIGSSDCRFEDNVDIALHGSRTVDRSTVSDRGEKFITVEDKASLKIYGKDKLPWTKLSSTLNMPTPIYRHQNEDVSSTHGSKEGLAITIFDTSLTRTYYIVRDFWKGDTAKEQNEVNKLVNTLNDVTDGQVVAIALQNYRKYTAALDLTELFSTIESVAGMPTNSLAFRDTEKYDAFALVFEKGGSYDQSVDKHYGKATMEARASIEAYGKKVSSVSIITAESKSNSFVDVLIHSLADGYPVLNLVHDVTNTADSWEIGDQIMIASTDYEWKHAEIRTITGFPTSNSVQLNHENYYRHYGAIEHGVDMRAEVALMTRNIKIHGELSPGGCPAENENCNNFVYDSYGCHIKVIHNFTAVHVEGVEIYHCGQPTDKGFYPLHFHMCEDVTYRSHKTLKRNSLHDTFQRAITIHGTYGTSEALPGVEVIENTAINVLGHAFFEEDGAERATVFRGNLAASVQKVNNGFFSTDKNKPTAFWFVTPETVSIDNVAAGGDGFGIWYTFPNQLVGPSADLDLYEYRELSQTAMYTTDNNVAHSNNLGGLNFDNILVNEDGDVTGCMRYDPRKNTTDDTSPIDQVFMYRLTAYKNRNINVWLRGGGFYIMQASLAESRRGVQLATGGPQHQYISHSVIMGESEGNNEYIEGYPDAFGKSTNGVEDFNHYIGVVFYDGPVWINDVFFTGFKSKENDVIVAGALGFNPQNKFQSSIVSSTRNLRFDGNDAADINRVFDGDKDEDSINGFGDFEGDEVATFRDLDGSVVACDSSSPSGPYQVYKPEKFIMTERSVYRENWKMAYSTDMYSKLHYKVQAPNNGFNGNSQMRRVNRLDASDNVYTSINGVNNLEYMAVLNRTDKYVYEFQFTEGFPTTVRFRAKGVELGQNVIMGVCLPTGTTKDDLTISVLTANGVWYKSTQYKGFVWVDDLDTLADDTTMSRLLLKDRFLYVHFTNREERNPAWDQFDDDMCAGGQCPEFYVTMNDGQPTSYTPCFAPTDAELNAAPDLSNVETCVLPGATRDNSWGAGDTFASKDGGLRDWGSWSECCNVDASNPTQRSRERACTFPTPYGSSGASCSGETTETTDCTTPCPVDGVFDDWSRWTDCACLNGSNGVKTRTRSCINTANGGLYCSGDSTQFGTCDGDC